MASISTDKSGRRRILFICKDGDRKAIHLGKMPLRATQSLKTKIESIVASQIAGHALDDETSRWLANLGDVLRDKLSAVGLVAACNKATLEAFLDNYLAMRTDAKPAR